jgi:hypothetical protein
LVQPGPARNAREDQGACPSGDEAGEQCAPHRARRDGPILGKHLEQEERGDERPAEERRDGCEGSRQHEQARLRSTQAAGADRERGETEPERDERCFGAEDETKPQRGEGGEQDAHEIERPHRPHAKPLERCVPAVTGE